MKRSNTLQSSPKRVGGLNFIIGLAVLLLGLWLPSSATAGTNLMLFASSISPPSVTHNGAGVVAYGGKVYVWSGYSDGGSRTLTTEIYDPTANTWLTITNFQDGRNFMAAFELNGKLYSVAGEGPWSGSFSSSVFRFDPQTPTDPWVVMNNFPVPRWMAMAAVCNGKAYVMGGRPGYTGTVPDVYEYNEAGDSWTARAPMPVPVQFAGTASHGGKVYLFGGNYKLHEGHNQNTNTVQVFDPSANIWNLLPNMPAVFLAPVTAVAQGDAIYVFAKRVWDTSSSDWVPNPYVWRYAPASGQWCRLDFTTPASVGYSQLPVNINGTVFMVADDQVNNYAYNVTLPEPLQPGFALQPVGQVVSPGATVTFTVAAYGYPPPSYQWMFNGNPLAGAIVPSLSISGVQSSQAGNYTCTISNPLGSLASDPATLTVVGLDFIARLNLSDPIGAKYRIDYSTDLNIWSTLTTITLSTSPTEYVDWTSVGTPRRFYRTVPVP